MNNPLYPKATAGTENTVAASPSFPQLEEAVLDYWKKDNTFQASIDQRSAEDNEFVFYDGPPFANGLPHYGHLLTGYVKDLVARYQTQRGHRVERRFGWDTHGLPAELEAMKQLGMTDKQEILEMGIDNFNDAARSSVLKYTKEWQEYVTRQARWVDFENDYKTLNVEYMESVIWAFKQLHEKGLTYQGFRVLPYCWKDETPLSNHELRMDDDVYKDRQDPSVTVTFTITSDTSLVKNTGVVAELTGVEALAWTTTPWTLPTNQALAVGPDIDYVVVAGVGDFQGRKFLIASELLGAYAKDLGFEDAAEATAAVVKTYKGSDLAGVRYEPLWDYFTDAEKFGTEKAWQILVADYVSTTDGTGLVHQAPAYGEEDQKVCEENGIPVILSIDEGAKFLDLFSDESLADGAPLREIAGAQIFEANRTIINLLKSEGHLIREKSYVHSYPHCWRCRTPLVYRAITSWYVKVTNFKDRMGELNEEINWIPENVKHGQFGKWVANARDWSISRNRFWGSPIPVWVSDDPNYPRMDVYGSLEELKADFGRYPVNKDGEPDLHRPYIDELTRPNPDDPTGKSIMRRVEDILDVWFDSGSMPYAQVHYPFENKEWFENHNPADFIVEYIGQTRGWFYTMHILATALFDRPAFTNVISHGIVLGSDGQKMSKSLRNYPDVSEVLNRDGSDAMRWFLMSSPILRGGNLIVTEQGIREGVRQVMLPLWNVYHFFALYTNAANNGAGYEAQLRYESEHVMDRFILGKTRELVENATVHMDKYDVWGTTEDLRKFTDALTNWYVRRSRERFFDEDTEAFDVLFTALSTAVKVVAPLLPLMSEEIYRGLTGERSVHLSDWPKPEEFADESDLLQLMEATRSICSAGSALRKANNLRVRQPLQSMTVAVAGGKQLAGIFEQIISDELNLKSVELLDASEVEPADFGISQQLKVNARAAGPRLGKQVQVAIKASKSGDWTIQDDGTVVVGLKAVEGGLALESSEYELDTVVAESEDSAERAVSVLPGGGFLVLNTKLTDDLLAEGIARDTIRSVQQARKEADLNVSDRIKLTLSAPANVIESVQAHEELVAGETLAVSVNYREAQEQLVEVEKA
ncbi:isoleucine--tRNA ligase [Rothia amarae]|uniref:Isoleucine--tRNA ligase n=1 Tax=Rothia amarae TaxID=169480 RepID=A0A7H2BMG2_9MICC|nr:isoleucine--tRNA ligase [Rothia amarae]QNV40858.1 isoleucine--tRNA ligase [Rothia amarae]